jgi:MarR family transcriptional regulator, transcriptional regulator for hemolysin
MAVTVEAPRDAGDQALSDNLSWLLAQASHAMVTELTSAFEDEGVTPRGHCVLSAAQTGQHTQKALTEIVGLDKTTMVVTVDALEDAGLAERRPAPSDRRARIIAVTPKGRRMIARGEQIVAEIQEDVLAALPEGERQVFVQALDRLVHGRLSTPAACSRTPRRRG